MCSLNLISINQVFYFIPVCKSSANVRGLRVTARGGIKGSRNYVGYDTRVRSGLPLTRGRVSLASQTLFPRVDGCGPSALLATPINMGKKGLARETREGYAACMGSWCMYSYVCLAVNTLFCK